MADSQGVTFIYGMPTTGKTTLREELEAAGFSVFDTDEWKQINQHIQANDQDALNEIWADPELANRIYDDIWTHVVATKVDYVLTNLHQFFKYSGIKPEYAFVRKSDVLLKYLQEYRSNTDWSEEIVKEWTDNDSFADIKADVGVSLIILGEGQYASDFVEIPEQEDEEENLEA